MPEGDHVEVEADAEAAPAELDDAVGDADTLAQTEIHDVVELDANVHFTDDQIR